VWVLYWCMCLGGKLGGPVVERSPLTLSFHLPYFNLSVPPYHVPRRKNPTTTPRFSPTNLPLLLAPFRTLPPLSGKKKQKETLPTSTSDSAPRGLLSYWVLLVSFLPVFFVWCWRSAFVAVFRSSYFPTEFLTKVWTDLRNLRYPYIL